MTAPKKAAVKRPVAKLEIIDDVIHYTTKAGHALEVDLDIPVEVFMKAQESGDDNGEAQFAAVRDWLGADFEVAYNAMGALERGRFMNTFFTEFAKAAELPLGESLSSSTS